MKNFDWDLAVNSFPCGCRGKAKHHAELKLEDVYQAIKARLVKELVADLGFSAAAPWGHPLVDIEEKTIEPA